MTQINLPALWFDDFEEATALGIFLANQYPEAGDTAVDSDTNITLELLSTALAIVDVANTLVYVDGSLAYDGGGTGFQSGWDGPGSTEDLLAVPPGEIIADGDMEAVGVASWLKVDATLTKEVTSPHGGVQCLRVAYDTADNPFTYQTPTTAGRTYRATGWARSDGTKIPSLKDGSGITLWTGTTSTAWQYFDVVYIASSSYRLYSVGVGAGYCEFDDVSVVEYHDYRITIDPTTDFSSEQTVTVRVVSETVGGAYTLDESYSFTIEDLVAPKLLSALATYATTIRATFDEGMLASSASGAADALNPDNYTIAYVPANDRQAAVSVTVTSVAQVSPTVYDLTTDIELTFWRDYLLTCGAIGDDSSNANALDVDYRTAGFASWTPPEWPTTRRFRIWDMLAQQNRDDDVTGDLERLVDCWQDIVWLLLWDADRIEQIWDVDRAQEVFLDARLQDLGNPHSFDMTENQKRKLLDVLVPSYRQHGTEPAIINLVRFFLGITVTILPYNSFVYRWVLGEDTLGQGTYLGPDAGDPALYTFVIQSLIVLTTEERRWIGLIADVTKPAHEHYIIQDPNDAVTFDHWELGYSRLGLETILH
jgi:phage tail-like protein